MKIQEGKQNISVNIWKFAVTRLLIHLLFDYQACYQASGRRFLLLVFVFESNLNLFSAISTSLCTTFTRPSSYSYKNNSCGIQTNKKFGWTSYQQPWSLVNIFSFPLCSTCGTCFHEFFWGFFFLQPIFWSSENTLCLIVFALFMSDICPPNE